MSELQHHVDRDVVRSIMAMVEQLRDPHYGGYEHRKAIAEAIESKIEDLLASVRSAPAPTPARELQERIDDLEDALNRADPVLTIFGVNDKLKGPLTEIQRRVIGRVARVAHAVVEMAKNGETEGQQRPEDVGIPDIAITGLPDCTVTPEVSESGVKLHVQPAPAAPAVLTSLRALVGIIERTGGYMTTADQESLRAAREVLAGGRG